MASADPELASEEPARFFSVPCRLSITFPSPCPRCEAHCLWPVCAGHPRPLLMLRDLCCSCATDCLRGPPLGSIPPNTHGLMLEVSQRFYRDTGMRMDYCPPCTRASIIQREIVNPSDISASFPEISMEILSLAGFMSFLANQVIITVEYARTGTARTHSLYR